MAGKLAVHVAPEANPQSVEDLIFAIANEDKVFGSVGDLLAFADERGISSRTEIQSMAVLMGLLTVESSGIGLSPLGAAFTNLKESLRGDIFHFLLYTGWNEAKADEALPSWAYRRCCDAYWTAQSIELSSDYLDRQVSEIISEAELSLASQLSVTEGVSFSRKSLRGVLKWLEALRPPVIDAGVFNRRDFCVPELILLALGYVMRDELDAIDIDILLSHSRRDDICRVCLLDPNAFDQALNWAISMYPTIIVSSEEAGFYGRYVRLLKRPALEDFLR
ncbi:MAG: hypothetical protein HND48_01305 [Chloroflexi bacterium]|jgi:hypothetical protein|nr:hypothetical protein [Chloroflexota bacterium]OQY87057.1 MAG: hypothetical protein B6D42_00020 [Anaerolineae bacterium UTCFX5]GIK29974.1 MAG: hypothetical protein BroJett007_31120 [Chloroflexota bacterium]